jgi:hypothetical protein
LVECISLTSFHSATAATALSFIAMRIVQFYFSLTHVNDFKWACVLFYLLSSVSKSTVSLTTGEDCGENTHFIWCLECVHTLMKIDEMDSIANWTGLGY